MSSGTKDYQIFLIDGVGALLSALILLLFSVNHNWVGIPAVILLFLGLIAAVFFVYSFCCFLIRPPGWSKWLRSIALANLAYTLLTTAVLILYWDVVTWLGWLYFLGEILILLVLSRRELILASRG